MGLRKNQPANQRIMNMIYICTNPELLAQRTDDTEDTDQREARVVAAIDAGGDVIADLSGCELYAPTWKHSGSFRDWTGGKHSQFHKVVAGLVAFTMESERETAERAAEAMTYELEGGNQ